MGNQLSEEMEGRFLLLAVLGAFFALSLADELTIEAGDKAKIDPDDYDEGYIVICYFDYDTDCEKDCLVANIKVDGKPKDPVEGKFSVALDDEVITIKNNKEEGDLRCKIVSEEEAAELWGLAIIGS